MNELNSILIEGEIIGAIEVEDDPVLMMFFEMKTIRAGGEILNTVCIEKNVMTWTEILSQGSKIRIIGELSRFHKMPVIKTNHIEVRSLS